MKTRTKLLGVGIALVGATAAAVGTSTFAWFTANRQATVTSGIVTSVSGQKGLKVELFDTSDAAASITGADGAYTLASTEGYDSLTDISGQGTTFYKAHAFTPDNTKAKIKAQDVSTAVLAKGYIYKFTLKITNENENAIDIALGSATDVSPDLAGDEAQDAKDNGIAKAVRCNVVQGTTGYTFGISTDVTNNAATNFTTTAKTTETLIASLGDSAFSTLTENTNKWHGAFESTAGNALVATDKIALAVAKNGTVNIVVTTWIEGNDAECINDNLGGKFKLNLQFLGQEA